MVYTVLVKVGLPLGLEPVSDGHKLLVELRRILGTLVSHLAIDSHREGGRVVRALAYNGLRSRHG